MKLTHSFVAPAPAEEVWEALLDPERVAPCLPGAPLTSVDGKTFTGEVKVKLGPVQLTASALQASSGSSSAMRRNSLMVVLRHSSRRGHDAAGRSRACARRFPGPAWRSPEARVLAVPVVRERER